MTSRAVCSRENWDCCVDASAEVYLDFFGFARLNDSTQYVDRIISVALLNKSDFG
uniref:Uncharacterized protein n=1 Tax=Raoultella ornithinolytica TaxID=54291 RepID=A0A7G9A692_RAOOR|nr:Hypothetical protein [Raoultella ornithinolytica]